MNEKTALTHVVLRQTDEDKWRTVQIAARSKMKVGTYVQSLVDKAVAEDKAKEPEEGEYEY